MAPRGLAFACLVLVAVAASLLITAQSNYARGVLRPAPPREAEFFRERSCPPRIVHQVYGLAAGEAMPASWNRGKNTWIRHLDAVEGSFDETRAPVVSGASSTSRWHYFLWDADAVKMLIRTHYPHLLATYLSYPRWVQRADMARYAILHKYGGLYADLDVMARRSWEPLRALCPELAVARADQFGPLLSPDVMLAAPQHPLLGRVLDDMPAAASSRVARLLGPYLSVMVTTGPVHLTRSFLNFASAYEFPSGGLVILGDGYYTGKVTPKKLVGHLRGRSWHEGDVALAARACRAPRLLFAVLALSIAVAHRLRRRRGAPEASKVR